MAETAFRCNSCKDGKTYTSLEAIKHQKETGHNSWRMLKKQKEVSNGTK